MMAGAGGAVRATGWRATAIRFQQFGEGACQGLRRRGVGRRLANATPAMLPSAGPENIGTPNLSYAAQYLACSFPCQCFATILADRRA